MRPQLSAVMIVGTIAGAILVGCQDQGPAAPEAPNAALKGDAFAQPDSGYIATPAGWFHESCVHEIPNGARVNATGNVTRADGTRFQIPACAHSSVSTVPKPGAESVLLPPTDNGWVEYGFTNLNAGTYHALTGRWKVPPDLPSGSYSGTQVFYSFPGLQNGTYIIQPVIQYGYNGLFGGSYWTAASWRCNSGSDCLHGTPINVSPGDSVYGTVTGSGCAGGACTWSIVTVDVTKGTRSAWTITDADNYNWATGGAVEVYGLGACNQYPDTGVFYRGDSLWNSTGALQSPNWSTEIQPGISPSCGFNVGTTTYTVSDLYNQPPPPPPLTTGISGPSVVTTKGTYTWTATPSGGTGSYSYQWWQQVVGGGRYTEGTSASQSATVSAGPDFWMIVQVYDGRTHVSDSVYVTDCVGQGSGCLP